MPQSTIVIGADEVGRHLARDLNESGEAVTLIDNDPDACHRASRVSGVRILCEDAASLGVLKRAGAEDARCLIAATRSDKVNLMVCELTKAVFHIPRLVARVNQEENAAAFEEAGIETVSPARATASGLHNLVLRPSLFRLLSDRGGTGHVAEVVVASKQAIGRTLADLALSGCGVVAVRRGDTVLVPRGALRLAAGDVVTLLGDQNAVTSASERLGSVEKPEG